MNLVVMGTKHRSFCSEKRLISDRVDLPRRTLRPIGHYKDARLNPAVGVISARYSTFGSTDSALSTTFAPADDQVADFGHVFHREADAFAAEAAESLTPP